MTCGPYASNRNCIIGIRRLGTGACCFLITRSDRFDRFTRILILGARQAIISELA